MKIPEQEERQRHKAPACSVAQQAPFRSRRHPSTTSLSLWFSWGEELHLGTSDDHMQHRVPVHLVLQEGWGDSILPEPPQPGWVSANFIASVCSLFFQKKQSYRQFFAALGKFSDMQSTFLKMKCLLCDLGNLQVEYI